MRVVIVGPGRIGCGYLAPLFQAAGWEVVLAARTVEKAAKIRRAGTFTVRTTGASPAATTTVGGIKAVAVDTADFARVVAGCDLVCTAVGVGKVSSLGASLARALAIRPVCAPIDVWVIENDDCARTLEASVAVAAAGQGLLLPPVGFAGGVAKVAVARGSWREPVGPEFVGDSAQELFIDQTRLITRVAAPPGVKRTNHYPARLREKLYVFNAAHAISAYLGSLRGCETVDQAVRDPFLKPMVVGCLLESRRAVLAAYPELGCDVNGAVAEALRRFADRQLADPVVRVARDPLRKLAPHDRLLGPVNLIRSSTDRVPAYFALGIAGALLFRRDGDEQARQLRADLSCKGVMAVLQDVCGLGPDDCLAHAVAARYRNFIFTPKGTIFPPAYVSDAVGALEGVGAR